MDEYLTYYGDFTYDGEGSRDIYKLKAKLKAEEQKSKQKNRQSKKAKKIKIFRNCKF